MDNQKELKQMGTESRQIQLRKPMLDIMLAGNKSEINYALALLKDRGVVKFDKVLAIPSNERIPAITKTLEGRMQVSAALTASIKSAFDNVNLRVGLSPDQMVELAEMVIDESVEDNLSLEDVLLFLQQLISGKAGKIYDRMDAPTFFELFETYRESRFQTLRMIRDEQHSQFKSFGNTGERASDDQDRERELNRSAMGDYLREKYKQDDKK